MIIGYIGLVSNAEDWVGTFVPLDADTDDEIDISAATEITLAVWNIQTRSADLTATLSEGNISLVSDTTFQWTFTAAEMANLCAQVYEIRATLLLSGSTKQLIIGTINVVDGSTS